MRGRYYDYYDYSFVAVDDYDTVSWRTINQSSMLVGNINYRFKLNNSTFNSGHGFGAAVGLNVGYFFSQKFLFAPFVAWETRDVLYKTHFNSNYLNDFNSNYNGANMVGNDSVVINYMANLVNGKSYFYSRIMYYGLMIKLPYKYMPILKVYTGYTTLSYSTFAQTINLQPYVSADKKTDKDYYYI